MSNEPVVKPIRVVLADDGEAARLSLAALLSTHEDLRVVGTAADGREVIALVHRLLPDLVLLDGRMPVVDGLEATRMIKHSYPHIAVVMHSMYGSLEAEARRAGADDFILKGCPPDQLVAASRAAVASCHGGRQPVIEGGEHEQENREAAVPECPHRHFADSLES